MKRYSRMLIGVALAGLALTWSTWASARDSAEIDAGVQATLQSFYAQHTGHHELVDKAAAVLVFPHVTKAGIGVAYDMDTLRRPVLAYVLGEQGLMGDLSLAGLKITPVSG